jgi:hypothetical protein
MTRKSSFYHVYNSYGVWLRDHYKTFQWLPLVCNIAPEVSPEVLATAKQPRAPSCALGVLATTKPTHLQLDRLSSNTIHTTSCEGMSEANWKGGEREPNQILLQELPMSQIQTQTKTL